MKRSLLTIICTMVLTISQSQVSHYVESDNAKIHYQTFGQGNPILIINGGPGFGSKGFTALARKIENLGYQAILFDQRGTGKSLLSKVDNTTITMDLMVDDIESIREDLKFSEWAVLGHSFGGMLANYYAAKHPERITAMIQSSSGGIDLSLLQSAQGNIYAKFSEDEVDSLNHWRQQYSSSDHSTARIKYNKLFAKAYVYHAEHIPVIANRLMEGDLALNRLVWNNLREIQYDCKNELAGFCKPVLIIQGKEDIISEALAYQADSVYCNSRIVLLAHCGHYGWLDQEERYLTEIDEFLAMQIKP